MKLYEIDEKIMACIDMETGEIIDSEALDRLTLEREAKIENVALWYKNLLADAEAYKAEKNSFKAKEDAAKKKAESLMNYLAYALNGEKFKTTRVDIGYRKSTVVECQDVTQVDDDYLRYKEPELDKSKVKKAIKEGIEVKGCALVENQNMQIK